MTKLARGAQDALRWLLLVALGVLGCRGATREPAAPPMFELLAPRATGVTFVNHIPEDSSFNFLSYLYYYNGGGVAVGDVNNDGLPDLYFTSNIGANHLYLNKGNYQFEDITERAGVADSIGWKTGVTMADVNGDGYVDIYVSGVDYLTMHGRNVLYINNGDGTFTDRTKEYGLDHVGYSTQALFFDYDGDGWLDMFLLNHSTHGDRGGAAQGTGTPKGSDRLFHNDHGHFVDVSERAGVADRVGAFGLGVVASDFNLDGCPDLYVANDFQENDYFYINNCNGTFTEVVAKAMGHTSRFSMGVDAADFNNDGRPDLVETDMLPDREDILKSSASTESWDLFALQSRAGFQPQYERNTLQLNRGSIGRERAPRFSDIGFLAGVAATDWSWSPLFADLDNDGYKDLFITNGVYRRPNDLDYISYISNEVVQASLARGMTPENAAVIKKMPQVPLTNYAFRNNGDLTFTNMAASWGLAQPGFSNGAAYVDLNNTGALDLVVNNINAPASVYRNRVRELNPAASHYLTVQFRGARGNTAGIGSKVIAVTGARRQLLEQMPTRGFESSVDQRLHFGLGAATTVESLTVIWPDRRYQVLTDVAADRVITLEQEKAAGKYVYSRDTTARPRFEDVTSRSGIDFKHEENDFADYTREPLIPRLLSTEGPALAIGDVNGDGLDDIYVGGAKWQPGRLYIQQADGTFKESKQPALQADSLQEDVDAVFFDANGDGHLDLYVVSGGNEFWDEDDALQDRLYINDGKGNFHRDKAALPRFAESGSCVVPGDYNGDGHVDLFVGRRAVARNYGLTPRSYLLENDGRGHFVDVTRAKAPGLMDAGMVTSATWIDYDNDGKLDLVVVGEWMPVRVFRQENGRFVDRTQPAGLGGTEGWWNTVSAVDVNGDGRKDLLLGNLGLNSYLQASAKEPVRMYVGDFFSTGVLKQILTSNRRGESYPVATRDELLHTLPQLSSKYPTYASFGRTRIQDLLPSSELSKAKVLEAHDFASAIAQNNGNGTFTLHSLPIEAQFAPINAIVADDFDANGHVDVLVAGNFFGVPPIFGRYDASHGLWLRGEGNGRFQAADLEATNLDIQGQVRHMSLLRGPHGAKLIAIARNNDRLELLEVRP
ncbi:MAG TPA: VCBS repeat-containing protein [Gemmatimonadaceae bacterium]|nr:VCBS repeat-containing protein [Gemmatimonadaceae bacterium]